MEVNLNRCYECAHCEPTDIFDLCKHSASQYSVAGKRDYHTIGHMRTVGPCRHDAVMFSPIEKRKKAA